MNKLACIAKVQEAARKAKLSKSSCDGQASPRTPPDLALPERYFLAE
ncbi:hypothetical protein HMPREF0388_0330 [Mobiluncus curtisii ATCC 51333]|uniref:Uncharacterized protein n=1 Tax=Mobiluncus curtisii ATCC 51333 TaxID=887326 RepID=E6LX57_9ACTO|nr:hypothetical protein HMPREF0388_0330 [Mobiluncus curtisii ATCC 51333]